MNKISGKKSRGFTLIELLVVVAIIGILASVVLAALNSARDKGQEAAIKSNLKNMITQGELSYDVPGNYSTTCAGVASMLTAINNTGATAACYSHNVAGDVNLRWGASAKKSDGTKNWSVNGNGVVVWDAANTGSTVGWDTAIAACIAVGGRLPSAEQLRALYDAYGTTPTGFTTNYYWSSTEVPSNSANAYLVSMVNGSLLSNVKPHGYYVRCVR